MSNTGTEKEGTSADTRVDIVILLITPLSL